METGTGSSTSSSASLPYVLIYKCRTCGAQFENEQEVLDHNNKHTGFHPYSCEDCKKAFQSKRRLENHGDVCKVKQSRNPSCLPPSNTTNSSNTQNPNTLPEIKNEVSSTLSSELEEKSDKTTSVIVIDSVLPQPSTSSTVIKIQQNPEIIETGDPTLNAQNDVIARWSVERSTVSISNQHSSLQPDVKVGSGQSGDISRNEAISSTTSSTPVSQKGAQLFGCDICVTMTGSSKEAIETHKQHEHMDCTSLVEPITAVADELNSENLAGGIQTTIGNCEPAPSRTSTTTTRQTAGNATARLRFPCPKCEKSFLVGESLVSHMNWHEGKKPYKCQECKLGFVSRQTLNHHLRNSKKNGFCGVASKRRRRGGVKRKSKKTVAKVTTDNEQKGSRKRKLELVDESTPMFSSPEPVASNIKEESTNDSNVVVSC